MVDQSNPIRLKKNIPPLVIQEGSSFEIQLADYFEVDADSYQFHVELEDGSSLPRGTLFNHSGLFGGTPGVGTEGVYKVSVTVEDNADHFLDAEFTLTIKPSLAITNPETLDKLKSQIWKALEQGLNIPEMADIFNRPITSVDMYYLLQRFATLSIWNVYNLDPPGEKLLLPLADSSEHYHVYDRGSCLIVTPVDLFSHKRGTGDMLKAARAAAREAYERGWTVELVGFDKMMRAAWVEIQLLGTKFGKHIEVLHFSPSSQDQHLYSMYSAEAEVKFSSPS